jgi:uncharacterized membrane-anchored protein
MTDGTFYMILDSGLLLFAIVQIANLVMTYRAYRADKRRLGI